MDMPYLSSRIDKTYTKGNPSVSDRVSSSLAKEKDKCSLPKGVNSMAFVFGKWECLIM